MAGYGSITPVDIAGSNKFLDELLQKLPGLTFYRAADCAAGIGRITKHLLLPRFHHVDVLEQSPRLLHAAKDYIQPTDPTQLSYLQQSLQVTHSPYLIPHTPSYH
jgi:protein N-terminal methyltransferase